MTFPPLPASISALWSGFTSFDWCIGALLFWSTVSAFCRGAIREFFALVGLSVGLLLASWNYFQLAPLLRPWLSSPGVAEVAAFLLLLIAVVLVCTLLGRLLRSGAHAAGLGFLDRLSGAVLGLARGTLAGLAVLLALTALFPSSPAIAHSRLAPYLLAAEHGVSFVVPPELKQQLNLSTADLMHTRDRWSKALPESDNRARQLHQKPK